MSIRIINSCIHAYAECVYQLFVKIVLTVLLCTQDVIELIVRLHTHLRVTIDQKTVDTWSSDETGRSTDWIDFWSFLTLTVDKCLSSRGTEAGNTAVKLLYEEIYKEVMVMSFAYIRL